MITKKTTLILGAGASVPYGFPSGEDLRKHIIETTGSGLPHHLLLEYFRREHITDSQIKEFSKEFSNSNRNSIDVFLEHRNEFSRIGKAAIAYEILSRENADILNGGKQDWYRYLFNKMAFKLEDFLENQLRIITFNYDRSFEQFFIQSLMSSYGLTIDHANDVLKKFPIVHVHGSLGSLPKQTGILVPNIPPPNYLPYGYKPDPNIIGAAANNIKIVHEDDMNTPEFQHARAMIHLRIESLPYQQEVFFGCRS